VAYSVKQYIAVCKIWKLTTESFIFLTYVRQCDDALSHHYFFLKWYDQSVVLG